MAKHFKNLKILKLDNTSLLEKLKANELIESVSLLNSNILSVNSFKKKVPEPLLTRNNMANYTQVKLNGVLLSESEIAKLKLGKMNVEHNDKIEVMDGVLAGAIFTIILGTPLNELIKDSVLLTHIKELLNKESTSSLVSLYELQTITWIGKNPNELTELNYLGYFNTKTIGNMEIFINDLKQLPNLTYMNLAGAIFTTDLNLNDFNITNFKYSFANCTVLQNVTIDKTIVDLEGTFRNCQNLRTVTIGENANLSNMIKTFYGCKGILNFTINNPNMTDTDNVNVFEESLISTLNFIKEPFNNIITSNLLKHAIYSSSTLNLDNKNRPDLYNLTFTANANLEKLTLNNTNIEEIDLTKATTNFTNLKYLEANNTNKLQNFKLNGNNLTSISFTNSSILIQKIKDDETPKIFTENKDYYSRVSVNDIELTEVEVIKLKNGNYKFNHADVIKFLNGPLINISFEITNGIIPTVILELFPDPTLAEYIRIKTNKSTINDIVSQNELNTIIYFGYDGLQTTSTVTSWFKEKTVNSWVGTEHLKNIQNVYLNGVLGTANEIIISSKEIKTLSYAFNGCTALTSITLPKKLPNLTNVSNYNNVFNNCNLDEVYIPLSKTGFGNTSSNLFKNCNIKKIIVREPDIGDIDPIDLSYMCKDSISTSIILECQGTSNENITNLSNTFQNSTALTSIILPSELPSLNSLSNTFDNCTALTSITLPSELPSLTTLFYAFYSCRSLTSITLPSELPSLNSLSDAFNGCTALTSITLPKKLPNLTNVSNYNNVFNNCNLDEVYIPLSKTGFGNTSSNLFKNCNIKKIIVREPDIGDIDPIDLSYMCKDSISTSIILECQGTSNENITNLSNTFQNSTALTSIILPSELPSLNSLSNTFDNCTALTSITLPAKLPKVTTTLANTYLDLTGRTIIYGSDDTVTRLNDIKYHNATTGVTEYLQSTLDYTNLENLVLNSPPGRIKQLFPDPTLAEYIRIKTNKSTINDIVSQNELNTIIYFGYDGLQTTSTVTSWFKEKTVNSWVGTEHLKNIQNVYLNGVLGTANEIIISSKEIKTLSYAFNGCTALTSITLPKKLPNLTNVSNYNNVFNNCNLDEVYIPLSKTGFGNTSSNLFKNCNIKKIIVREPDIGDIDPIDLSYMCKDSISTSIILECQGTSNENITNLSYAFRNCSVLTSITLPNQLPNLTNLSYAFRNCTALTSIILPSELPSLNSLSSAFYGCTALTSIILPSELPSLNSLYCAFYGCTALTSITLPNQLPNLTNLSYAFQNSTALTSITLPNQLPNLTNLSYAFDNCTALTSIILPSELPSLTTLFYAFRNCSVLKSITLPSELPSLNSLYNTFYGCRSLTSITLPSELPNLTDLSNTFDGCSALTSITLPSELPNLTNLSYAFRNCIRLTSVFLPPILPKLTTPLASTHLESSNRTYIYHKNDEVFNVNQITLHPELGTKDYSNLIHIKTYKDSFDPILLEYFVNRLGINPNNIINVDDLTEVYEIVDFPNGINNFDGLQYCENLNLKTTLIIELLILINVLN